jgi:tetratricopeptide (TPR) repeat protein
MKNRDGTLRNVPGRRRRLIPRYLNLFFLALFLNFLLSSSFYSLEQRNLSLLVLADEEFRQEPGWKALAKGALEKMSSDFEKQFGLRFAIGEFSEWQSNDSLKSIDLIAEDLDAKITREPFDILIAFTSQKNLEEKSLGCALFKEGIVVVLKTKDAPTMVKSLEHEVAHLFGSVHVDNADSLMDIFSRGREFDVKNAKLMLLNKSRSFHGTRFPLPRESWEETIALGQEIAADIVLATRRRESGQRDELEPSASGIVERIRRRDLDDVYLLLAQIYIEQERYTEAIAACRKALRINPKSLEALNFQGIALRRNGHIDEAIGKYKAILEIRPNHALTLYNLGIAYGRKGARESARDCYLKAVEIKPNFAEAYSNLGEVYLRLEKVEEAETALRKAISVNPQFAMAYSNLAEAYFQKGDYGMALEEAERALSLDPELVGGYTMRGKIFHKRGEVEKAKADFQKALSLNPKYERAYFNLGNCYLDENKIAEAKKVYERAAEINPQFAEPHASLGALYLLENKANEAIRELRLALDLGLESASLHFNLSSAYLRKGLVDQAIGEAKKVLELDPSSAPAHNNLGIAFSQKGMTQEAIQEFQACLDRDPRNKEALLNLGTLYLGLENLEKALVLCLGAAEIDPSNAALHNNIAVIYFRKGEYAKSWEYVQKAEALGFKPRPDFLEELKKKLKNPSPDMP